MKINSFFDVTSMLAILKCVTVCLSLFSVFYNPTRVLGQQVVNGDFETGDLSGWNFQGTAEVGSASAYLNIGATGDLPAGEYFCVFGAGDTPSTGIIEQSVVTQAGRVLQVSFNYGHFQQGSCQAQTLEFAVRDGQGDLVLAESVVDISGTTDLNTVMDEYSFQFATFDNLTTIQFSDTSPCTDSSDGFLDNVSIQLLTNLGDVNLDGSVDLLDVAPFVDRLVTGTFQAEADINEDGVVDLLDVAPFVALLSGG